MRVVLLITIIFLAACEKIFDSSMSSENMPCPPADVHAYQFAPPDSLYVYVSVTTYTPGELFIGDENGNLFPPGFKMRDGQKHDFNLSRRRTLWYRYLKCGVEDYEAVQQIAF